MAEDNHSDGAKVVLPEQPTGVGPGFLSSYWKSEIPLPRMNSLERVRYFFLRGLENVTAIPLSSGITIATIAVALFILGGFLLILQNIDTALSTSGNRYELIAYFEEGVEDEVITTFLEELRKDSRVASLGFVSKADALAEFEKELGANAELLDGLAGSNPLPASVEITLKSSQGVGAQANELVNDLRNSDLITEVSFVSEWVEESQELLRVFRFVGFSALIVVLLIILFLISNTIRLVMYMRRNEIAIMLLVGASDDVIRIPFMIGGLLQGLVGSILGLGFLRMAFFLIVAQMMRAPVIGVAFPQIFFLSGYTVSAILFLGAGMGCLGSLFALRRFMKV